MADQFIALDEPAVTDKKLDTSELAVGVNTVQRERINISDPTSATGIAPVTATGGLKVDLGTDNDVTVTSGNITVSGTVAITDKSANAALSNVAGSAASVTILASNGARTGATIWNDSTAILYITFGATASATSCTVKMAPDAYYEVPFGYTGIITGIWASATGSARVTEIS